MIVRTTTVLIAALVLSACTHTQGTKFEMSQVQSFTPGTTTFGDVTRTLGKPSGQSFQQDGSFLATWVYTDVGPTGGLARSAGILFDKDGKLVRVQSVHESGSPR